MKRLLIAFALLAVVPTRVPALPSKAYFGIYGDFARSRQSVTPAVYSQFSVVFWCLPSERGFQGMTYHVTTPSNVIVTSSNQNPQLVVTLGCIPFGEEGLCAILPEGGCALDWLWTHQLTCLVTDNLPGVIEVGPLSCYSALEAFTCEPGYPAETVTILNKFGINQNAVIGIEPQTWGALKSLYR